MDEASREFSMARNGSGLNHAEPEQAALFDPPRATWRQFFRRIMRGDYKAVGVRIFGGDPESARIALGRVIDGRPGRYADWEWIDHVLEVLGAEAQREFVHWVCDRFGFERPTRLPDAEATREELEAVKATLAQALSAMENVSKVLARLDAKETR